MIDKLVEELFALGVREQMGVFFFLFIAAGVILCLLILWIMRENKFREAKLMTENNQRENRYISTIEKLADSLSKVEAINLSVTEIRKDLTESNMRQESMIGRVLDRLASTR